jgi:ribosomal protein L11 methyltransferase
MIPYVECAISLDPFYPFNEILTVKLSDEGFESFTESDNVLNAYIPEVQFNAAILEDLKHYLTANKVKFSLEYKLIPPQNWNETWEKDYAPVILKHFTIVAPFHGEEYRKKRFIEIEPKMSFGTGHHETTALMCEVMENLDFKGKKVLDMGSGTGILSINATQLGAAQVLAYDIEEWAVENAQENFLRNAIHVCEVYLGDVKDVTEQGFEVILANINKNVLFNHLPFYAKLAANQSHLLLSGFFTSDNSSLIEEAKAHGFILIQSYENKSWSCLHFRKN